MNELTFDVMIDYFINNIIGPSIQFYYQLPYLVQFSITSFFSISIIALSVKTLRRLTA